MPNPPTIDVADDWLIFDNLQPVTLLNKDGSTKSVPWALQEGIDTIMADMGDGTIGFRTFSTWHVWKQQCDPFVPQINCKLTDKEGRNWYVANVNLHVWGNKYQLDCELQAGLGVVPVNLPVYVTTTSTTCAPTYAIRHLVRITDEQFVCAYPTSDGWSGYSGAEVGSGLFRCDLVDPYIVNDLIVTVRSEALDPNTDTVYIRRNGVAVTANIAGELYQYTFTGSEIQPNDTYDIVFNSLYPLPESAVQFSVQSVINCEGGTFCGVHFDNGTYFCAQGTHTGWEAYNNSLPQAGITSAIWNWSPQDLSKFTEFTVTVNAHQMQSGSVYVKKNNVNISGNIASTSWTYTEDQAQYADAWELFIDALGAIPEAVVNASVVVACVPTTTTTTTTSTSTTSTTSTSTTSTSTSTTSTSSTTSSTTPTPTWDIGLNIASNGDTFSLNLIGDNPISLTVDWGDSTVDTFTTTGVKPHIYTNAGSYTIRINGSMAPFTTIGAAICMGVDSNERAMVVSTSAVPFIPNLDNFGTTFLNCSNLTSVPADFFQYNTQIQGIGNCFTGTGLTSIPSGLLDNLTNVLAAPAVFSNCTSLTSIPSNLFDDLTACFSWTQLFDGCTGITSIPADLFKFNTQAGSFAYAFRNNTSLTSLPADLFRYNINVAYFNHCFFGCTGITTLPTDLFRYNTLAESFGQTFTNVPLTCAAYSQLLVELDTYNANQFVSLGANISTYDTYAVASRDNLINAKNWIITDAGPCFTTTTTSTTSTSSTTSTTSTPAPLVANYFEINDPQTTYINWTPIGSNGFSFQNNYTNATFNTTSPITITQNGFIRFTDIILAGGSGAMGVFAYYGNVIAFFPGYTNDIWTPCTVGSGDFSIQFLDSAAQTRTVGQLSGTIEWYPTTTTTTTSTTSTSTTSTTTTSTTTTSTTTTAAPYVTSGLRLFVDAGDPASYSGSGTAWNDLSGNGNDLTLTGSGTTFNSTGGYFSFNGSGYAQRLACSNMPTGNNAASMSVWFRMPQSATPHYDLMCYGGGVGVGCGTSIWLALWPVGTRQVYWFYNCYDFGGNTGVNGDVWVNVTGTKDSSGLRKLYVNGVLVATGVNENMSISGTQFRIAWDNYENQPKFVGDLSIGMVYDKELTPAEVIQNYEAFRGRYDLFVNYDISNTSSTFQDAAGTIPAIANNDPVRLIKDVAPAGKWDQNQVLYGDPPLLEVPGQNGLNTLYYIGLNQGTYRAATGASSYPFLPGSYTAFFVYTRSNSGPSNGGNADIMRVQAQSGTDLFENGAHGNVYVLRNTAGTLQSTGGWTNPGQTGYGLIIYDYDETLSEGKVYDAANAQLGATLTPAAPLSNKQMRWDINNNGDGSFHLAEIRVYQRCLDATERATIIAQLQAKWGI